jgi:hypothetical protein
VGEARTADDVIAEVEAELSTPAGRSRVDALDALAELLLARRQDFGAARRRVHARSGTAFSVNTTQGTRGDVVLSLKVAGVECAQVHLPEHRSALLRASGSGFKRQIEAAPGLVEGVPWRSEQAAQYVSSCTSANTFRDREACVQELVVRAMGTTGLKSCRALRNHRPVRFAGIPIQFPVPVAPRARSGQAGRAKGHLDILARRGAGALHVFELKRPGARDSAKALDQALIYAAALDHLMARNDMRARYWNLFESRRRQHPASFGAVALVEDTAANAQTLIKRRTKLDSSNRRRYALRVMLYTVVAHELSVREM